MDIHPPLDVLSAAADGELAPGEGDDVHRHLAGCPTCAATVASFEAERRRLRIQAKADHAQLLDRVLASRAEERHHGDGRQRRVRWAAMSVAALVLVAAGLASAARAQRQPSTRDVTARVSIDAHDDGFEVQTVQVAVGTMVQWRNEGAITHHLVRRLGPAELSEDLAPGQIESAVLDEPGTYEFLCTIHAGMRGTVTVEA